MSNHLPDIGKMADRWRDAGINAPPGREIDVGMALYAALKAAGFSERTIFTTLACEVALAAHDSGAPIKFIEALANAASAIAPHVPAMRAESTEQAS